MISNSFQQFHLPIREHLSCKALAYANLDQGFEDAKVVIAALKSKGVTKIGAGGFCWGGDSSSSGLQVSFTFLWHEFSRESWKMSNPSNLLNTLFVFFPAKMICTLLRFQSQYWGLEVVKDPARACQTIPDGIRAGLRLMHL
ncbi:hypothetical protein HAX54_029166 [Datura stramonium]|uniref:Uncharacterized protein n=1 Tax=Datura stramonium TaxID=4076 RepID=A0ABS8SA22_DATST|nr:hypothetical protein [Datura stramonium]